MSLEIERKFLVDANLWVPSGAGSAMVQSYFFESLGGGRVRLVGQTGFITFKGPPRDAARRVREESEFCVPRATAEDLLRSCCVPERIEKVRYEVPYESHVWEVDVFQGANAGLVMAEVELKTADEPVDLPPWVLREVTEDPRYSNYELCRHPIQTWTEKPDCRRSA